MNRGFIDRGWPKRFDPALARRHERLHWDYKPYSPKAACGLTWSDFYDTGGAQSASFREFLKTGEIEVCDDCAVLFIASESRKVKSKR